MVSCKSKCLNQARMLINRVFVPQLCGEIACAACITHRVNIRGLFGLHPICSRCHITGHNGFELPDPRALMCHTPYSRELVNPRPGAAAHMVEEAPERPGPAPEASHVHTYHSLHSRPRHRVTWPRPASSDRRERRSPAGPAAEDPPDAAAAPEERCVRHCVCAR